MLRPLSRRAVEILLHGRHASIGGKNRRQRVKNLTIIAVAYTRSELLEEQGVGDVIADEIENWVIKQGLKQRTDRQMISTTPTPALST